MPTTMLADPALTWMDLPQEVYQLLEQAADAWEDTATADRAIQQALEQAEGSLDVMIAAYRYFFYKRKDSLALQVAEQVMQTIRAADNLPSDWDSLEATIRTQLDQIPIRLYLNAYAASGLILARLGQLAEAEMIANQVSALEHRREFGGKTVRDVLTALAEADEDD